MLRRYPALSLFLALIAGIALLSLSLSGSAHAAQAVSPFGVGLPDGGGGGGWFPGIFAYIASRQAIFYRQLTASIRSLKESGHAFWFLAGLSFLYGVFHAAGPGHGKAVISSYLLANRQTVRNGIVLSFIASFVQALAAVVLVVVAALMLRMTSYGMTRAAYHFEVGSYVLVVLLGFWLVWSRVLRPMFSGAGHSHGELASASVGSEHHHDNHANGHPHEHRHQGYSHGADCGCGHSHIPAPELVAGSLDLKRAWTAIASVGMRPCTGAVIVLVFSLSQGLFAAGIASALIMGIGTGLTVATLATLTVGARGLALRLAGRESTLGHRIHRAVEIGGAVVVLLFGLTLLTATLGWGGA
ncbi:nickel/cobalt transporter [Faunimonas pinastri]|nr:nickel/cobalt transporter [Faunimonas pinastri]